MWFWDGSSWTSGPSNGPPSNACQAAAYDASRDRIVVYGVRATDEAPRPIICWEWDGVEWNAIASGAGPPSYGRLLAYDPVRERIIVCAPCPGGTEMWYWDGESWGIIAPSFFPMPYPRIAEGDAMATDLKRKRVVLYAGDSVNISTGTWEWDGVTWTLAATTGPGPRGYHSMVYDSRRERVLLFGGHARYTLENDLWEWDGSVWTEVEQVSPPSERFGQQMAYDPIRDQLVMFGGTTECWDGSYGQTWTCAFSEVPPGPEDVISVVLGRMGGQPDLDVNADGEVSIGDAILLLSP